MVLMAHKRWLNNKLRIFHEQPTLFLNRTSFLDMRNCYFGRKLVGRSWRVGLYHNFYILLRHTPVTSLLTCMRNIGFMLTYSSDRF